MKEEITKNIIKKRRNRFFYPLRMKNRIPKNKATLIYWKKPNLGDAISPIIVEFLLKKRGYSLKFKTKRKIVLSAVGSVLSLYFCDRVVWGSGFLNSNNFLAFPDEHFDVRLIRGPLSENLLKQKGLLANSKKSINYGDPALLMPLIYRSFSEKKYQASLIPHISVYSKYRHEYSNSNLNIIDFNTKDYKKTINEICASKIIISSSLHGIILAEAYGVPAIWLRDFSQSDFKFYDYYYGTNRKNIKYAESIKQATTMQPMSLPNLDELQHQIISSFPYDLWESDK